MDLPANPAIAPHVIGYLIAILVPMLAFDRISFLLWKHLAIDAGVTASKALDEYNGYLPAIIGALERFLYVGAFLAGATEFVAVWLAVKVAGGWKGWSDGEPIKHVGTGVEKPVLHGRALFNTSLISNALSLIWAIVGVAVIQWSVHDRLDLAIASGVSAFSVTYGMWWALSAWCNKKLKRKRDDEQSTGDGNSSAQ